MVAMLWVTSLRDSSVKGIRSSWKNFSCVGPRPADVSQASVCYLQQVNMLLHPRLLGPVLANTMNASLVLLPPARGRHKENRSKRARSISVCSSYSRFCDYLGGHINLTHPWHKSIVHDYMTGKSYNACF